MRKHSNTRVLIFDHVLIFLIFEPTDSVIII